MSKKYLGKKYFIAGTDTGVGKTLIAASLLAAAKAQKKTTLGLKPVAAGCSLEYVDGSDQWVNEDAMLLREFSSEFLPYSQINPIALKSAVAPHIAAQQEGKTLRLERILGFCRGALMKPSDFCVIEGAGGWRVPLNPREFMSGLVKELNLPVILVVGMRLGCINHAMLTAEAIQREGVTIAAWVANTLDKDMPAFEDNLTCLKTLIPAPLLGVVPNLETATSSFAAASPPFEVAKHLDIHILL